MMLPTWTSGSVKVFAMYLTPFALTIFFSYTVPSNSMMLPSG